MLLERCSADGPDPYQLAGGGGLDAANFSFDGRWQRWLHFSSIFDLFVSVFLVAVVVVLDISGDFEGALGQP